MLRIENNHANYEGLTFNGKKQFFKKGLSVRQIKSYFTYNQNQYNNGNFTLEDYLSRNYKLLNGKLPKKISMRFYLKHKSKIKSARSYLSELPEIINSVRNLKNFM